MKFLHLSDLHLGKKVNEFSMLEEQNHILAQITECAIQKQVDGILIAGDVYDKAIPPVDAIQLFDTFLNQMVQRHISCYIISGNHDSNERLAFASSILKKQKIYLSTVFKGTLSPITLQDEYGPLNLYLLPFIKPAYVKPYYPEETIETYQDAIQQIINHTPIDPTQRNILVAHQFIMGASRCESEELSIGGLDQIDASIFSAFDYVALGHLHGPQWIKKDTIRYCGTPLKYSFSEVNHTKTVTYLEIQEKGTILFECIPLVAKHDLQEIKGSYLEVTAKSFYEHLNTDHYFHITLTDEEDIFDAIGKLRTIYPNIMRLDYDNLRTKQSQAIDGSSAIKQQTPLEQFQDFYQLQNNQPLTEEQQQYCQTIMEEIWEEQK